MYNGGITLQSLSSGFLSARVDADGIRKKVVLDSSSSSFSLSSSAVSPNVIMDIQQFFHHIRYWTSADSGLDFLTTVHRDAATGSCTALSAERDTLAAMYFLATRIAWYLSRHARTIGGVHSVHAGSCGNLIAWVVLHVYTALMHDIEEGTAAAMASTLSWPVSHSHSHSPYHFPPPDVEKCKAEASASHLDFARHPYPWTMVEAMAHIIPELKRKNDVEDEDEEEGQERASRRLVSPAFCTRAMALAAFYFCGAGARGSWREGMMDVAEQQEQQQRHGGDGPSPSSPHPVRDPAWGQHTRSTTLDDGSDWEDWICLGLEEEKEEQERKEKIRPSSYLKRAMEAFQSAGDSRPHRNFTFEDHHHHHHNNSNHHPPQRERREPKAHSSASSPKERRAVQPGPDFFLRFFSQHVLPEVDRTALSHAIQWEGAIAAHGDQVQDKESHNHHNDSDRFHTCCCSSWCVSRQLALVLNAFPHPPLSSGRAAAMAMAAAVSLVEPIWRSLSRWLEQQQQQQKHWMPSMEEERHQPYRPCCSSSSHSSSHSSRSSSRSNCRCHSPRQGEKREEEGTGSQWWEAAVLEALTCADTTVQVVPWLVEHGLERPSWSLLPETPLEDLGDAAMREAVGGPSSGTCRQKAHFGTWSAWSATFSQTHRGYRYHLAHGARNVVVFPGLLIGATVSSGEWAAMPSRQRSAFSFCGNSNSAPLPPPSSAERLLPPRTLLVTPSTAESGLRLEEARLQAAFRIPHSGETKRKGRASPPWDEALYCCSCRRSQDASAGRTPCSYCDTHLEPEEEAFVVPPSAMVQADVVLLMKSLPLWLPPTHPSPAKEEDFNTRGLIALLEWIEAQQALSPMQERAAAANAPSTHCHIDPHKSCSTTSGNCGHDPSASRIRHEPISSGGHSLCSCSSCSSASSAAHPSFLVLLLVQSGVPRESWEAMHSWGNATRTIVVISQLGEAAMAELAAQTHSIPNFPCTPMHRLRVAARRSVLTSAASPCSSFCACCCCCCCGAASSPAAALPSSIGAAARCDDDVKKENRLKMTNETGERVQVRVLLYALDAVEGEVAGFIERHERYAVALHVEEEAHSLKKKCDVLSRRRRSRCHCRHEDVGNELEDAKGPTTKRDGGPTASVMHAVKGNAPLERLPEPIPPIITGGPRSSIDGPPPGEKPSPSPPLRPTCTRQDKSQAAEETSMSMKDEDDDDDDEKEERVRRAAVVHPVGRGKENSMWLSADTSTSSYSSSSSSASCVKKATAGIARAGTSGIPSTLRVPPITLHPPSHPVIEIPSCSFSCLDPHRSTVVGTTMEAEAVSGGGSMPETAEEKDRDPGSESHPTPPVPFHVGCTILVSAATPGTLQERLHHLEQVRRHATLTQVLPAPRWNRVVPWGWRRRRRHRGAPSLSSPPRAPFVPVPAEAGRLDSGFEAILRHLEAEKSEVGRRHTGECTTSTTTTSTTTGAFPLHPLFSSLGSSSDCMAPLPVLHKEAVARWMHDALHSYRLQCDQNDDAMEEEEVFNEWNGDKVEDGGDGGGGSAESHVSAGPLPVDTPKRQTAEEEEENEEERASEADLLQKIPLVVPFRHGEVPLWELRSAFVTIAKCLDDLSRTVVLFASSVEPDSKVDWRFSPVVE